MEVPPPNVTARLLSLDGEGTGRSEIHLDQVAPSAVVDVSVELESEISTNGQPPVLMTMTTRVHTDTAPR